MVDACTGCSGIDEKESTGWLMMDNEGVDRQCVGMQRIRLMRSDFNARLHADCTGGNGNDDNESH